VRSETRSGEPYWARACGCVFNYVIQEHKKLGGLGPILALAAQKNMCRQDTSLISLEIEYSVSSAIRSSCQTKFFLEEKYWQWLSRCA